MKKFNLWKAMCLLFAMLFAVSATGAFAATVGMANPAAVYCQELGHEYKKVLTIEGESGVCVLAEGVECGDWDFLEGKCGAEYSYCAKNGYGIVTRTDGNNPFSSDYAVCIPNSEIVTAEAVDMSVTSLMGLMGIGDDTSGTLQTPSASFVENPALETSVGLPSEFDWRNYNGQNWNTPVKSQNGCGSCWAFAALASIEAKIKIARNDSNFNVDLSEQELVSDCLLGHNCSGGWSDNALEYVRTQGITDESCTPYIYSNSACSRCPAYDRRQWHIDSWGSVPDSQIKEYIIAEGPLTTYLYMQSNNYSNEIYRCENVTTYNENVGHGVSLVGYNDTGGYWIAKNSWGTSWQDNGYFKIAYGNCRINEYNETTTEPFYVIVENETQWKTANALGMQVDTGTALGELSLLELKDKNPVNISEQCSGGDCGGISAFVNFSISSKYSNVSSIYLIANHRDRTSNDSNISAWDGSASWIPLGKMPNPKYSLLRYKLCDSSGECSQLLSGGNISMLYSDQPCTNCTGSELNLDWLRIEFRSEAANESTNNTTNSAPSISNVTISPGTAYANSTLSVSGSYIDNDNQTEMTPIIKWFINSAYVSDQPTLGPGNFTKGDFATAEYTPYDGIDYGAAVNSSAVEILDTAPIARITSPTAGTYAQGTLLMFNSSESYDIDGDALEYTWSSDVGGWLSNDSAFSTSSLGAADHAIMLKVREANSTLSGNDTVEIKIQAAQLPPAPAPTGTTGGGTIGEPLPQQIINLPSMESGRSAIVTFTKADQLYVNSIKLTAKSNIQNGMMKVKRYKGKPSGVTEPDAVARAYLSIDPINFNNDAVDRVEIRFRADTGWIQKNESVVLLRNVNGTWVELPTKKTGSGEGYYNYAAETPGFSYFVIATKMPEGTEAQESEPNTDENAGEDEVAAEETVAVTGFATIQPSRRSGQLLGVVAIFLIVGYFYYNRK
ncbi:MAG: C1 family peptidase [archaeon]